jgi:hypothetical protein
VSMLPTLLALTLTSSLLVGCTTLTTGASTRYVDTSCEAFRQITYSSSSDTPETVAEIRAHNRALKAICP